MRTVVYPSPDLAAGKDWYRQVLGIDPYFDEPFYVGYSVAGYELGLLPTAPTSEGALTYWGVADVPAAFEEAISQGATVHAHVADVGGGIVTATVWTPHRQILGLIYNPHFGAT